MPGRLNLAFAAPIPHCGAMAPRTCAIGMLRAGCLEMHYQPILELSSNTIRKVEALARLRDGDRLVMPGEFLPQFGDEELYELFTLGLDTALRDRNDWLMHGHGIELSVNFPPRALADPRYFEATERALARHGCPPHALTLEILESHEIGNKTCALEQFRRFSDLGVQMAEDDLGSGHSSLTRLRELAFDWIKIDRGIVRLTGRDNVEVLQFVHQLTRLGHGLGKLVIVEGVEDLALTEAIRILGADAAQGFGIARPMSADALLEALRHNVPARATASATATAMLPCLAQLLLVEERLQACQGQIAGACSERAPAHCVTRARSYVANGCDTCPQARFETDVDAIFPKGPTLATAKRALVHAAMHHGLRSTAYRQARHRLACTA